MIKKRLDTLIFERSLAESREKAKAMIMSGCIFVDGQRSDKPGAQFPESCEIELRGKQPEYVSRGGLKLQKALKYFDIITEGKVCIDCGASTGGFTDCLLKEGAKRVYAVDVGYGQLAWSIRNDERVTVMERTNARYLTPEHITEKLDLAVIDVSFISLKLILPPVRTLLKDGGEAVCLIKPQFEAGRGKVGKKGVVRDEGTHIEVLDDFLKNAALAGFTVRGLTYSPIRGPEGNIEYLGYLTADDAAVANVDTRAVVRASHSALDRGEDE